jgi:hypothetical protein
MDGVAMRAFKFWTVAISIICGQPHWIVMIWGPGWLWWFLTVGVLPRPRRSRHLMIGGHRVRVDRDRLVITS